MNDRCLDVVRLGCFTSLCFFQMLLDSYDLQAASCVVIHIDSCQGLIALLEHEDAASFQEAIPLTSLDDSPDHDNDPSIRADFWTFTLCGGV